VGVTQAFWKSNDSYCGQWNEPYYHGLGVLKKSDGTVYAGQWKDHAKAGLGV